MVNGTDSNAALDNALGSLGLLLIALTGFAVEHLEGKTRIERILARLVLTGVAAVGWSVDRLPLRDTSRRQARETTGFRPRTDIA